MPTHIGGVPIKEYNLAYYHARRAKLVTYLGGKCVSCGTNENLEFDHVNKTAKSFNIKRRLTLNNAVALSEINKCQLLCNACHEKKTAKENISHGISYALKQKCKCETCLTARKQYNINRRMWRNRETRQI